ncbi:SDR family oxidoreductase [Deminuibacter soli]|uniref:SDR family NAD(P)-dependent oxidoreductase n=1 Tax=Deminuibacter soli TaxID=2291815 RepID=A0A3E1NFN6_9BACT|nr:SDR family NAD(P)-dependent oxidoreductase [Deminuibacter soli]RFM26786.1 SDR family NAD(P)-dependent oxidoreductase [Deminuibacter soli]
MNIINKTVLITGGGSGIGFQTAKLLSEKGNTVIITGRNEQTLQSAVKRLQHTSYIVCDITSEKDLQRLADTIATQHQSLDVLINNAGSAYKYDLLNDTDVAAKATQEIGTNYIAAIGLTHALLPLLRKAPEAAIVNVTSIVAFVPSASIPTYSASKAALHFYSQTLRHVLAADTNVKVFELMPPLVNTDFSKEIGGANGIPPEAVAQALWEGFATNNYEIHVGDTANIRQLFFAAPDEAFKAMNQA